MEENISKSVEVITDLACDYFSAESKEYVSISVIIFPAWEIKIK